MTEPLLRKVEERWGPHSEVKFSSNSTQRSLMQFIGSFDLTDSVVAAIDARVRASEDFEKVG